MFRRCHALGSSTANTKSTTDPVAAWSRADALGLYVSEGELRPPAERLSPGAFLDYDETSMIASGSREEPKRKFSVVVSQCYVQPHTKYYLSVRGGKDAAPVSYKITAMRVAARIPLNGTVSGSLCDNRYLHYFWELPATPTLAGVRTTLRKTSGELDAFFMRYERCAGPIGTNLERVSVDAGHCPQDEAPEAVNAALVEWMRRLPE